MINTYNNSLVDAGKQQKVQFELADSRGGRLEISLGSTPNTLRITVENTRRLFFFECDAFSAKTTFRNEYGLLVGKVAIVKQIDGWVQIDQQKYHFHFFENDFMLALVHQQTKDPLLCEINNQQLLSERDGAVYKTYIPCLAFAFAWSLEQRQQSL